MSGLPRTPPKVVRDQLCREVAFQCPVDDCGVPYLTFHHFAPPWRVKKHHDPQGMVALCSNHAAKADGGYYPDEYFANLKIKGARRSLRVHSDYLRKDLVVLIGGTLFYGVRTLVEIDGEPGVFFNRDAMGYLLLNFTMPSLDGGPRAWMEDNVWIIDPGAKNIECPPRGRYLKVTFENGDMFHIEYRDVEDAAQFRDRYPDYAHIADEFPYPLAIARLYERSSNGIIEFGAKATRLPNSNEFRGGAVLHSPVGISVRGVGAVGPETLRRFADVRQAYNLRHRP